MKAVKEVSKLDVDIFYINGIYSFFYNFLPLLFGKARKKIISVRGMLHPGALSQKRRKKEIYLNIWKMLGPPRKFFFHATNFEEEKFIKQYFGQSVEVYVAPNLPKVLKTLPHPLRKEKHLHLLSIGLISPMKNYMEVLRALGQCQQQILYDIYGPVKDFSYWLKCSEVIKSLPGNITVQYKGEIPPAMVFEVLNSAQVFILPSKSENFGHAIFEAFTAGRPVITSHNTPWNNLQEAKAGFNVSPENLNELSSAISFFANADNITLAQWSEGAKKYSESAIDLRFITDQYKDMFSLRT